MKGDSPPGPRMLGLAAVGSDPLQVPGLPPEWALPLALFLLGLLLLGIYLIVRGAKR